jgi:hypothetical protein
MDGQRYKAHGKLISGHRVHPPSTIRELDFDFVVVTAACLTKRRVVVRKRVFSATTEVLEERFALVSLDVDLYKTHACGAGVLLSAADASSYTTSTTAGSEGPKSC